MSDKGLVLTTGGAGYIGSHTCLRLFEAGYGVVVFDNFSNSDSEVFNRLEQISGKRPLVVEGDIRDPDALKAAFEAHDITAVIHFAGLKAVGESVEMPIEYYQNNVAGTLHLLEAMKAADVKTLVFSSSATVYGDPATVPISEDFPTSATNPYGRSKLIIEEILADFHLAHPDWRITRLRYFNPVGAHSSGLIGEDPKGIPNNLLPYVSQTAVGIREKVNVFGGDYPTPDGTGVRDYIHVMDLALGHVAALNAMEADGELLTVNLGTGQGYSVIEMIEAFSRAAGKPVPYEIVDRRPGDIATCYADPAYALSRLGWKAEFGLDDMCRDAWKWQSQNPNGYK